MTKYLVLLATLMMLSCGTESTERPVPSQAVQIIEESIEAHGGDRYDVHDISFDFRNRSYRSIRDHGNFQYERIFEDSLRRNVRDVLTNNGLQRFIDDEIVTLTPKDSAAYSNSVNSVIYFTLLPYFLQDPAVFTEYLGTSEIHGELYNKIKVTFSEDQGGKDFEDQFIYWFHQKTSTMDYLAYNYKTDGGGARFRAAYNKRREGGIRFADYENYKPNPETMNINSFDSLYNHGLLDKLSLIENTNIKVQ